jgi:hypothetical protein
MEHSKNLGTDMSDASIFTRISKIYSSIFFISVMLLLFSFVASRELSLTTLSSSFRWRKSLIETYTSLRFEIGDRVFNGAVVGRDGWLFYTGEESIMDHQNTTPLSKAKISNLQKRLDKLNASLEERGTMLLVVIPPNKDTIYPQFMPDEIPVLGEESRLDQFVKYMRENGNTPVVDLRQTLLNASQSENVYFKTDTHWNSMGAYYGYVEIMKALSRKYPDLTPHPLSDFEYKNVGSSTRDISIIMGLPNYKEEDWVFIPKFEVNLTEAKNATSNGIPYIRTVRNKNDSLPQLVVYGDSFYGGLAQFVEPHFGRVKFIPFTTDSNIWSLDWLQQENPDIVIIEIVERYLDTSLPMLLNNN